MDRGRTFLLHPCIATAAGAGGALAVTGSGAQAVLAATLSALLALAAAALVSRTHDTVRAALRGLLRLLYPVQVQGLQHVPGEGPALLACNHVSYLDALLIIAHCPRPVRFLMDHRIHDLPFLRWLFRAARTIPVAPAREDHARLAGAFDAVALALEAGEVVCIFPEGGLTRSGELAPFRRGLEHILGRTPVPVVPLALRGLWGTWFSRYRHRPGDPRPRRPRAPVALVAGPALAPATVTAAGLERRIAALRGDRR
jgi:1-acyl-sn-glycerol-3-phosphate acyltransferase